MYYYHSSFRNFIDTYESTQPSRFKNQPSEFFSRKKEATREESHVKNMNKNLPTTCSNKYTKFV